VTETDPERAARGIEPVIATSSEPPRVLPSWPRFEQDEIARVSAVLACGKVNAWTGGECRAFEEEYAEALGTKHAIALANGTLALELALEALGVGAGDEVIVSPRSFIASASAVVRVGARPVFADIDVDSGNLTPDSVRAVISSRTKALIAVHLGGWPCRMDELMAVAEQHGLRLIEDCAQAHGASYQGKPVGSWGHVAAFSFCQDKIITTGGEGGLVTTDDTELWSRMWSLKDHGKSYEACFERHWPPGFRWLHESFGSNYRMTELQAAIGRLQLKKLPTWVAQRRANADRMRTALEGSAIVRDPDVPPEIFHSRYRYYCHIVPERLAPGWSRDRILSELQREGVPCFSGSCSEMYLEKAFADRDLAPPERLKNAQLCGETALAFLVHPTLTEEDLDWMSRRTRQVLSLAS
jgi:dTDP-4-amino-4,6-dideoxygalactose transaminase